jgi:formylmethanofuran--tetrahydromethanopterin N-formyltransferase
LLAACQKATGHASSTILCDCEAGIEQILDGTTPGQETPDGRIGALLQFHVPRFRKDRVEHLERVLLARLSQNVLTCPTTRCFNALDTDPYFKLGRKIAFFGDGHQFRSEQFGEKGWTIPTLGGEFFLSRRFGYADGIMGGNLWFLAKTEDAAIDAADRAAQAADAAHDVITTFPGGVAASASKAGSSYKFLIASTFAEYCPTLKSKLGAASRVPDGVTSIMEIIVNGSSLEAVAISNDFCESLLSIRKRLSIFSTSSGTSSNAVAHSPSITRPWFLRIPERMLATGMASSMVDPRHMRSRCCSSKRSTASTTTDPWGKEGAPPSSKKLL